MGPRHERGAAHPVEVKVVAVAQADSVPHSPLCFGRMKSQRERACIAQWRTGSATNNAQTDPPTGTASLRRGARF
eukprot:857555-Pleurochrysis_carterae.AAC.3